MTKLLQTTKIYFPSLRKDIVSCPRLLECLNEGLLSGGEFERRLTLVSAPTGYGKTMLVSEWLKSLTPTPSHWELIPQHLPFGRWPMGLSGYSKNASEGS